MTAEKTKTQKNQMRKDVEEKPKTGDAGSWSRDQQEKSYYYDDACGYELYQPEDDDDDDEESAN